MVPFAKHGKVLASRIPGAELVAAEGGDHVTIFTHHDLVQPRVVAFLRAHAPAGGADTREHPGGQDAGVTCRRLSPRDRRPGRRTGF